MNLCCSHEPGRVVSVHCDDVRAPRIARIWVSPNVSYKNRRLICRLLKVKCSLRETDLQIIKTEIE